MEETRTITAPENVSKERQRKPKSAGNKNFRKHNKIGFYRFMQRKRRKSLRARS